MTADELEVGLEIDSVFFNAMNEMIEGTQWDYLALARFFAMDRNQQARVYNSFHAASVLCPPQRLSYFMDEVG